MTFRSNLRKSSNHDICEIHKSIGNIDNQYDLFNSIREALKHIRSSRVSCMMEKLPIQSLVVKFIQEFVDGRFTIHYLNNALANGTNTIKWGITNSSTCTFCDQQQTFGHVIGGWKTALLESRYNWCHDPILPNIYKTIKPQGLQTFVDIESYRIHQSLLAMSNDQISLLLKVIIYYH